MRYREFLVEYRRDITAQNYGDKILRAFAEMPQQYLTGDVYDTIGVDPNTWSNLRTVAYLVKNPESHGDIDTNMRINGQVVEVNIKTAPEILRSNASLIINGILALLESKDPTPNKEYTQWLVRMWCKNPSLRFEDINRNDMLGIHYLAKRRRMLAPEHADINRFRSYADFESTMDELYDADEITRGASVTEKGTSELVHEDPDMRIIVPKDVAAACYYGQGTRWCTAATRGTNYFEHYNRQGPLYIILPKKPKHAGEKYQLHAESDQLMNEDDDPISYTKLMRRFPTLHDWLLKNVPKTSDWIGVLPDDRLVNYWRTGLSVLQSAIDDELQHWEDSDTYYTEWQEKKAIERGYVDDSGAVDWYRVYQDDDLNDYANYNPDYESAVFYIDKMKNYSADEIRKGSESQQVTNYTPTPEIKHLDLLYKRIFENIGLSHLGKITMNDLLIYPIQRYVTNRKIINKETTDGYVFALARPWAQEPRR